MLLFIPVRRVCDRRRLHYRRRWPPSLCDYWTCSQNASLPDACISCASLIASDLLCVSRISSAMPPRTSHTENNAIFVSFPPVSPGRFLLLSSTDARRRFAVYGSSVWLITGGYTASAMTSAGSIWPITLLAYSVRLSA